MPFESSLNDAYILVEQPERKGYYWNFWITFRFCSKIRVSFFTTSTFRFAGFTFVYCSHTICFFLVTVTKVLLVRRLACAWITDYSTIITVLWRQRLCLCKLEKDNNPPFQAFFYFVRNFDLFWIDFFHGFGLFNWQQRKWGAEVVLKSILFDCRKTEMPTMW